MEFMLLKYAVICASNLPDTAALEDNELILCPCRPTSQEYRSRGSGFY